MNMSLRWLFFAFLTLGIFCQGLLASSAAEAAGLAQVKGVRVHADGGKVRIVVDADGEVDYRTMTLANPGRIVVDLSGARLAASVPKSQDIGSPFAKKVRIAQNDATTVRVVVESEMYTNRNNYDVFSLEGGPVPYRVVLDFGNLSGGTGTRGSNIDFGKGGAKKPPKNTGGTAERQGNPKPGNETAKPETDTDKPTKRPVPHSTTPGIAGKLIVIDPGHGGSDTGAIGPTGVTEKSIALRIAKRLTALIEAQGGKVILTRTADTEVSPKGAAASDVEELQARCDIANRNAADIFISIHLDAFSSPDARGTTGYYYVGGSADSKRLADCVKRHVIQHIGTFDRGTKGENFYVCRHTDMPAMLLETAFISNPQEEQMMNSAHGVEQAANGIAEGLAEYFG